MFEHLGFGIHFIQRHGKIADKKSFDDAMPPDHINRNCRACRGECRALIAFVTHQSFLPQPFEHRSGRCLRDVQPLGNGR